MNIVHFSCQIIVYVSWFVSDLEKGQQLMKSALNNHYLTLIRAQTKDFFEKTNYKHFSWGRSEHTDRNVELYPQFFSELITAQLLRFHMVSPQLVLLIIVTMQSYNKFYLKIKKYGLVDWVTIRK